MERILTKYTPEIDPAYADENQVLGIDQIALTANPAIIVKGVALQAQKRLFLADEKKYRITAPMMLPKDIYRNDELGEYEISFTPDNVETIYSNLMMNLGKTDIFNVEHSETKVPGYLLEAWIVIDPANDKANALGLEVPKDAIMGTLQFTDKEAYELAVKEGRTGFSIEGDFGLKQKFSNQIKMNIPDGEHLIDGKVYVVVDGEVKEVKEQEVAAEEVVEEEVVVEAAEEETTEEEAPEVEAAVDPTADAQAILDIVTPVIDARVKEILEVVADLRNEIMGATEEETEGGEVEMTATQKFSQVIKFLQNNG